MIWDESTMAHKDMLMCLDRLLRDLMEEDEIPAPRHSKRPPASKPADCGTMWSSCPSPRTSAPPAIPSLHRGFFGSETASMASRWIWTIMA